LGRIASIDFGKKRIGLAISDESFILATPLKMVEAASTFEKSGLKLIEALAPYKIDEVIIGLPLHLSGHESPLSQEVRGFKEVLEKLSGWKITLWDERLSTAQADKLLKEGSLSRKKRVKVVDSLTALILLQSYLEHKRFIYAK
jgi:putative Holliday junction resolvase